ncbi:HTH domain-containing protein [Aeoliella sp.]|uniref:HTH domain-containing protein n=1 Tax=Aeoliella sp. TaxID=2795800 RepID=UPI003CCBA9A2
MAKKKTTTRSRSTGRSKGVGKKQATARKTNKKKTAPTKTLKKTSKKLSALDAAAKVLGGSKEPMTTKEMIEAMAAKKLWTSPGGQTPDRTLYSAILREINRKGKESRFKKAEWGKFALAK